jgi:hypothetical protein
VSRTTHQRLDHIAFVILFLALLSPLLSFPARAQQSANEQLSLSVDSKNGTYQLAQHSGPPMFSSNVAAQVNLH